MDIYYGAGMAALPVGILIFLMVKRHPWPSYVALPFSALLLYLLKLVYFQSDPAVVNATVAKGVLEAATPVLIIWGAVLLFKVMEASGSMDTVRGWLNHVTPNRVAQLMIISFAFSFMIEGASGFGTPPALAAPLLVGLGFEPVRAAVCCLIMNSFPVSFGAVGTPTWFGFGNLGLAEGEILEIGWKTALMHGGAALIIPLFALRAVVGWEVIRRNLVYIYLSVLACLVPYCLTAYFSYEFPALVGGGLGFAVSILLARGGWGLAAENRDREETPLADAPGGAMAVNFARDLPPEAAAPAAPAAPRALLRALFPLWGSLSLLVLTRLEVLPLKAWLQSRAEMFGCRLGTLGDWEISWAGVASLRRIFGTAVGWECALLFVPAIVPFFVIMVLTACWYRMGWGAGWRTWRAALSAMRYPAVSLAGALVLVTLLMDGGAAAPAALIGQALARLTGAGWFYIAPYIGALGAFFSGSNTVSNLTFGGIQLAAARALGLAPATVLALQSVGGALGHLVCINSIVAVGSVLGLASVSGYEGQMLKRTFWPAVLYGVLAIGVAWLV